MSSYPLLLVFALYSLNPITVSVYPAFAMAPATFRITVLVPRHLENRKLCLSYDGGEMRRSCHDLQGFNSRRSWTVYWGVRTAGEYSASAELTRMENGKERIYRTAQAFRVIGME